MFIISLRGRLVDYDRNDQTVQVVKEKKQVPAQLGVGFVLVGIDGSENLGGIKQMSLVNVLADIVRNNRHVQQEREPVTSEQKNCGNKSLQSGLGGQKLENVNLNPRCK